MSRLKILAISGSLKSSSSNTTLLKTMSGFDDSVEFHIYNDLEQLPAFNPDKETGNEIVADFKKQLKEADGVVISTPEYAFGIPGVLKNALDWTVSSGELNEKPVIAISASPMYSGGEKAMTSLLLTLSALGTDMNAASFLSIPDVLKKIKDDQLTDEATLEKLGDIYERLIQNIRLKQ